MKESKGEDSKVKEGRGWKLKKRGNADDADLADLKGEKMKKLNALDLPGFF